MYDFIISGAGLSGALIASVLKKKGFSVFIFDSASSIAVDQRVSSIGYGARSILDSLGFWNGLSTHTSPIYDIYASSSDKLFYLHFNADKFFEKHTMPSATNKIPLAYTLPNCFIQKEFQKEIEINFSLSYHSVINTKDCVIVNFKNGQTIKGRIFICAEGKNSLLRDKFNIPTYKKKYMQYAITCCLSHTEPHNFIAQEIFYKAPFALLPLKDVNQSSLIFTSKADFANLLFNLSEKEFINLINKKCNLTMDAIISKRSIYPLSLTFALQYSRERVLFFGDAIHSIHPVAGQGLNLSIYDVASLCNSLMLFDIQSEKYKYIFSKFYHDRFTSNLQMAKFTDYMIRLFAQPITGALCGFGLSLVDASSSLKRFFIKRAIGL